MTQIWHYLLLNTGHEGKREYLHSLVTSSNKCKITKRFIRSDVLVFHSVLS